MARPHVPKFGAWDPNSNAPAYTAVFDQARAGKGGKMVNPNDPAENPDLAGMYGDPAPPPQRSNERPAPRGKMAHTNNEQDEAHVTRPRHERRASREDLEVRRSSDAPGVGRPGVGGRRSMVDRDGNNEGSGHNPERSPLHPQANRQASRESARQGAGSEASIPRNSRGRNSGVARMEEPQKGGALPKFGTWDPKDPTAGEGYTVIFQKLSHEKKSGEPVYNSRMSSDSPVRNDDRSQMKPVPAKTGCGSCTIL